MYAKGPSTNTCITMFKVFLNDKQARPDQSSDNSDNQCVYNQMAGSSNVSIIGTVYSIDACLSGVWSYPMMTTQYYYRENSDTTDPDIPPPPLIVPVLAIGKVVGVVDVVALDDEPDVEEELDAEAVIVTTTDPEVKTETELLVLLLELEEVEVEPEVFESEDEEEFVDVLV